MQHNPFLPHSRRSIRLRGWDYASAGAYFVTIVTRDREAWFDHPMFRVIVEQEWYGLPKRFPTIRLDEFVVMPNHVHFVVWLDPPTAESASAGTQLDCAPLEDTMDSPIGCSFTVDPKRPTLGWIVRTFKAVVARRIGQVGGQGFAWQRNYYERIIRSERALQAIRRYIRNNPNRWTEDREFPR